MNEISNKTLAILVVIAILISLIGLFIGRARVVTVGKAGAVEAGIVQADVLSDIQIAIDGGMDLRDDFDLVAGGAGEDSTTYNEYIYVAAVGSSRLDISYRASCNLFLYDSTGVPKADACVPAAEDDFYNISIVDASTEHFDDIDTPGVEPPNCVAGGVTLCDGGTGGLDAAVWPNGYGVYQNVNIAAAAAEDNIGLDCDGNVCEGFKVAIQIAAPINEPPGDKTSTVTFVGASCASC